MRRINSFTIARPLFRSTIRSLSNILVLNCGSSSIKYKVIDSKNKLILDQNSVERLTQSNYEGNMKTVLDAIKSTEITISAVGHRWVNGGDKYSSPVVISDKVEEDLTRTLPLAPYVHIIVM